jgi:hypothetical protein
MKFKKRRVMVESVAMEVLRLSFLQVVLCSFGESLWQVHHILDS